MSNAVQVEQKEPVKTSQSAGSMSMDRKYVAATKPSDDELYGFRAAITQSMEQAQAQTRAKAQVSGVNALMTVALVFVLVAIAAMLIFAGTNLFKSKPESLYLDLGTQRYEPAGLGGRLIVQWTGNAAYKFTVDPLDASHIQGFGTMVANPPHAISFRLVVKDSTDGVACQKDVVIPTGPAPGGTVDHTQAITPRPTPTGDTMQNTADASGRIGETVITGSLPCDLDAYKRIAGWEFFTDFPPLSGQKDWQKHEDAETAKENEKSNPTPRSYGGYYLVKSIPAPIEGDDEIVSDNPSKGVVSTNSGRAFLFGTSVLTNPALDWQIFPADIHYRCEKNAMCLVTKLNSRSAVHAHLMK
jgi:hypothetical protein